MSLCLQGHQGQQGQGCRPYDPDNGGALSTSPCSPRGGDSPRSCANPHSVYITYSRMLLMTLYRMSNTSVRGTIVSTLIGLQQQMMSPTGLGVLTLYNLSPHLGLLFRSVFISSVLDLRLQQSQAPHLSSVSTARNRPPLNNHDGTSEYVTNLPLLLLTALKDVLLRSQTHIFLVGIIEPFFEYAIPKMTSLYGLDEVQSNENLMKVHQEIEKLIAACRDRVVHAVSGAGVGAADNGWERRVTTISRGGKESGLIRSSTTHPNTATKNSALFYWRVCTGQAISCLSNLTTQYQKQGSRNTCEQMNLLIEILRYRDMLHK